MLKLWYEFFRSMWCVLRLLVYGLYYIVVVGSPMFIVGWYFYVNDYGPSEMDRHLARVRKFLRLDL